MLFFFCRDQWGLNQYPFVSLEVGSPNHWTAREFSKYYNPSANSQVQGNENSFVNEEAESSAGSDTDLTVWPCASHLTFGIPCLLIKGIQPDGPNCPSNYNIQ